MSGSGGSIANSGRVGSSFNVSSGNQTHTDNSVQNINDHSTTTTTTNINNYAPKPDTLAMTLDWLSDLQFEERHHAISSQRKPNTGNWFLKHEAFLDWCEGQEKRVLFCPGIPGAGKSVIASIAINYLLNTSQSTKDNTIAVIYVYCNYKEKDQQFTLNLMRNLLQQLAREYCKPGTTGQALKLPNIFFDHYNIYKDSKKLPQLPDVIKMFHMLTARFQHIYLVIDAVDEMEDTSRDELLNLLKELVWNMSHLKLMATFRPEVYVAAHFELTCDVPAARIEIQAMEDDVRAYITGRINEKPRLAFLRKNPELLKRITDTIIEKTCGMFLLARFHIDSLEKLKSPKDIMTALQKLPTGIEDTYLSVFDRLQNQADSEDVTLAQGVLMWVSNALRPLRMPELQHALAIKLDDRSIDLDEQALLFADSIISCCAGLVILDGETQYVRLVHHTAQEFIQTSSTAACFIYPQNKTPAHQQIACSCIRYLSIKDISRAYRQDKNLYGFWKYAVQNWGHHARMVTEPTASFKVLILGFLKDFKISKFEYMTMSPWPTRFVLAAKPLEISVMFGLYEVAKALLEIEPPPFELAHALYTAIENNHTDIISLLQNCESIYLNDNLHRIILTALNREMDELAWFLVNKIGMVNSMRPINASLLWKDLLQTYRKGQVPVRQLTKLIHRCLSSVHGTLRERLAQIFFEHAIHFGYTEIAQCIREHYWAVSWEAGTLQKVAEYGYIPMARLLLSWGFDINATDDDQKTSLFRAVYQRKLDMVCFLVSMGATVDVSTMSEIQKPGMMEYILSLRKNGVLGTKLIKAALRNGLAEMVEYDMLGFVDLTAMPHLFLDAIEGGSVRIVELCLGKGAVPCAYGLMRAARNGHAELVRLLLKEMPVSGKTMSSKDSRSVFFAFETQDIIPVMHHYELVQEDNQYSYQHVHEFVRRCMGVFTYKTAAIVAAAMYAHIHVLQLLMDEEQLDTLGPWIALILLQYQARNVWRNRKFEGVALRMYKYLWEDAGLKQKYCDVMSVSPTRNELALHLALVADIPGPVRSERIWDPPKCPSKQPRWYASDDERFNCMLTYGKFIRQKRWRETGGGHVEAPEFNFCHGNITQLYLARDCATSCHSWFDGSFFTGPGNVPQVPNGVNEGDVNQLLWKWYQLQSQPNDQSQGMPMELRDAQYHRGVMEIVWCYQKALCGVIDYAIDYAAASWTKNRLANLLFPEFNERQVGSWLGDWCRDDVALSTQSIIMEGLVLNQESGARPILRSHCAALCRLITYEGLSDTLYHQQIYLSDTLYHQQIYLEKISRLLDLGADPDGCLDPDCNPLMYAVKRDSLPIVRLLVQQKAKLAVSNRLDGSLLYRATEKNNFAMIELLLDAGADPNQSSVYGESALARAERYQYHSIAKLLKENGACDTPIAAPLNSVPTTASRASPNDELETESTPAKRRKLCADDTAENGASESK
ncbi:hypothetical protein DFH27DRAFT_579250 [Peziza echinospora]|nr:hypothetical protein DFH27DRAFT_579250 [Peziza echinospora]